MSEIWTVLKVLKWTQGRFAERGIATARLDAEVLLAHVLKKDRVGLYTHFDQPLSPDELTQYRELIKRRLQGEPVAYLVEKREFRSLELDVDRRVLVPRPETETLVELAVERASDAPRVVDVGTGSGAIALAMKAARPAATVIAIDRSPEAAEVARANATKLKLDVDVRVGDLLAPVESEPPFELILSNPPYIPTGDLPSLPPEVLREPKLALDGGADGLAVIRRLVDAAVPKLAPGGTLAVELGLGQAPAVRQLFEAAGLVEVGARDDLAGIARVVFGRAR